MLAVHVQQPGALKPRLPQVRLLDLHPRIPMANNCAAPGSLLDKNVGEAAFGTRRPRQVRFNAELVQLGAMQFGMLVRAYRAYITSAQAPLRRGDHCGGYLAAEMNFSRYGVGFPVALRELREPQHDVRGVLSNACEIGER